MKLTEEMKKMNEYKENEPEEEKSIQKYAMSPPDEENEPEEEKKETVKDRTDKNYSRIVSLESDVEDLAEHVERLEGMIMGLQSALEGFLD